MLANRPGFRTCLCFSLGIIIASLFPLSVWVITSIFSVVLLLAIASFIFNRVHFLTNFLLVFLVMLLGFVRYTITFNPFQSSSHITSLNIYDTLVLVDGWITDRDEYINNTTRLTIQPLRIFAQGVQYSPVEGKLVVTLPRADSSYTYGDEISASGILAFPDSRRNPGEMDYRASLERNGIYAQLKVPAGSEVSFKYARNGNWLMRDVVVPLTGTASQSFERFHSGQVLEFMRAIVLNQRSSLEYEILSDFKDTGTLHILAVSGLHVVFIVIIAEFVLSLLFIPKRLAPPLVIAGVILYTLMTGAEPPVMRAGIFLIFYYSGIMFQLRRDALNLIGITGLFLLIINPKDLFDVGFQLSFGAVLGIYFFNKYVQPLLLTFKGGTRHFSLKWWLRTIGSLLFGSAGASLGTMLILVYYFHRISPGGLLLNILFVPASSIVVGLGFFELLIGTVIPILGMPIAKTLDALVLGMFWMNRYCAKIPGFVLTIGHSEMKWLVVLLLFIIITAAVYSTTLKHKVKILIAVSIVFLAGAYCYKRENPELRIAFLDVGQGDSAVISFPDGARYLIDGGDFGDGGDAGIKHVIPYLRWAGIRRLNGVIISHPNRDHYGGINSVIQTVNVDTLYEGIPSPARTDLAELYTAAGKRGINRTVKRTGDTIGNSQFWRMYVLSPSTGAAENADSLKENENSLVILAVYGLTKILFTGDVNFTTEQELVKKYGTFLTSTILKVAHHGSKNSTGEEFLKLVSPEYAVISVGSYNTYGNPSPETISRLTAAGIRIFRTDINGSILINSDGKTIFILR